MNRVIIIGHPMAGKSTKANKSGLPVFCTDPKSTVREPNPNVTYMPEGLKWEEQSAYAINNWLNGKSWVIEGVGAVRILRKWASMYPNVMPCDAVVFMSNPIPQDKHVAMRDAVDTIWKEIAAHYKTITTYI